MRDLDDSTLWNVSDFERMWAETGNSGFVRLDPTATLSSSLMGDLRGLRREQRSNDVLDVVAACIRYRESALVLLRHNDLVWPVTLFPQRNLYHLARPIIDSLEAGNLDLQVMAVEPPGLRLPRFENLNGVADKPSYRPLPPLLWALALNVPRAQLLPEIGGHAAYRLSADFASGSEAMSGALGPALRRLRLQVASLEDIGHWPGMGKDRATRLLNGVYLQGGLTVLRTHRAARDGTGRVERLRQWLHLRPRG